MSDRSAASAPDGDVRHQPQPSTSAHADRTREPVYANGAGPAKPTVHINVTGGRIDPSPISPATSHGQMTNHERAATAESSLTKKAKAKLAQNQAKDAKRMSKVLREEGRSEDKGLKSAIKELERLQKVHKQAAKDEAATLSSHAKSIKLEHKLNMRFLAARAKHEAAVADVKAKEEALAANKGHVQRQTEALREKESEVLTAREKKMVDDRDREAKLRQLTVGPASLIPA